MNEIGGHQEAERLKERERLIEEIDKLDGTATSEDSSFAEALEIQDEIDSQKKELFDISTDEENIARIKEFLPLHQEFAEEGMPVTIEDVLSPWGFYPEIESLSLRLQKELEKIKEENLWIVDFEEGIE